MGPTLLTLFLASIPLSFTALAQQPAPPANASPVMAIDVNAGPASAPCTNSIKSLTVMLSDAISVPGFGYHCYTQGVDFQQALQPEGLTCITRTDNQNSLPAGVTHLGEDDGHHDRGHWQCAVAGWPMGNCSGDASQMATYDVHRNTYTWSKGGMSSFEVQCQYTGEPSKER